MNQDGVKEAVAEKDVECSSGDEDDEEEEEIPQLVPMESPRKKRKLKVSALNCLHRPCPHIWIVLKV